MKTYAVKRWKGVVGENDGTERYRENYNVWVVMWEEGGDEENVNLRGS